MKERGKRDEDVNLGPTGGSRVKFCRDLSERQVTMTIHTLREVTLQIERHKDHWHLIWSCPFCDEEGFCSIPLETQNYPWFIPVTCTTTDKQFAAVRDINKKI